MLDKMKARADVLIIGLVAMAILYWVVIGRPQRHATRAVTAEAGRVVSEKRGEAARDTARIIERHFTTVREFERTADAALANIKAAQSPADLHGAGAAAVCLLSPAGGADDPACALRRSDPGQPEG